MTRTYKSSYDCSPFSGVRILEYVFVRLCLIYLKTECDYLQRGWTQTLRNTVTPTVSCRERKKKAEAVAAKKKTNNNNNNSNNNKTTQMRKRNKQTNKQTAGSLQFLTAV